MIKSLKIGFCVKIREKIYNLVTGEQYFTQSEDSFKYRYVLLASMLIASTGLLLVASAIRYFAGFHMIALIDFSTSFIVFYQYWILRNNKKNYNYVSSMMLGLFFLFFTLIVIVIDEDIKLIWFANLIVASYLLRGYKFGLKIYFLVIGTIITLYIFTPFGIQIDLKNSLLALTSYSTVAIFMTFSEIQHRKNILFIKKSSYEISRARKKLYESSRVDPNTKLPNKIVLNEALEEWNKHFSLVVIDIHEYDLLLNQFGEEFVKKGIRQVAKYFRKMVDNRLTVYHVFDGRFALLIKNPDLDEDINIIEKLKHDFENIKMSSSEFEFPISFLAAIVRDENNALSKANMLLLNMKSSSSEKVEIYVDDKKLQEIQKNNLYWSKRLPELLKEEHIIPYYQPIVDNYSGEIVKYEVLVRAIDNTNIVSPYHFLPSAKSKGLLQEITKVVIDKSFKDFADKKYDISINITEEDLHANYLVSYLQEKSIQYNIDPNRVYLEVLESINSKDSNSSNEQFQELKSLGFKLAIDDFGAEASNFSRLMNLEADVIKIDGQFIKNLDKDLNSHKIVEAIVSLSKKMNAKTVAEFVHSKEIYIIVKMLGIDFAQGFYFSEPLPIEQIEEKVVIF